MSAQLEDGYTRTANELLDHLMKQRLNGTQHSIIYCVIRNTYGFQRKSHAMSLTFIAKATGIHKDLIKRELDRLIDYNVIKVFKEAGFRSTREIGINKATEVWNIQSEPKGRQSTKQSTVGEKVHQQSTKQSTPTVDESVYQERNSFKENIKETTTPPEIMIQDEYANLHGKIAMNMRLEEIKCIKRLLDSQIPPDFIISSMKEQYQNKLRQGDEVTTFTYYEKGIQRMYREHKNPIATFGQHKKGNDVDWDAIEKRLEAKERGEQASVASA